MLCALKSIGSALGVENDQTHETLNLNPHRLRHYPIGAGGYWGCEVIHSKMKGEHGQRRSYRSKTIKINTAKTTGAALTIQCFERRHNECNLKDPFFGFDCECECHQKGCDR